MRKRENNVNNGVTEFISRLIWLAGITFFLLYPWQVIGRFREILAQLHTVLDPMLK